ncbi:hypothetical protein V5S96_04925 [Corynebacterium mastitidis]|uniref:Beta-N-acetylglucosaminidase n=1 Tax=Corynebacterium mastitidis TaxID=161890 RepID=A0ABU8NXH4_9CORY
MSTRGDDAVRRTSRPWRALPLVLAAGLGIAACSSESAEPGSPAAETTQTAQTAQAAEENTAPATTHSPTKADKEAEALKQVAATYASLAPAELFEKFESCTPNGLEGSHECSGPGIGQFQFYDSSAKATSSTQQLTQLRSSHVMRDTGDIVVGWSTLGTSAVITVVDNKEGLVMQQLVSSDKVDPEKRIVELGLADAEEAPGTESASAESSAPTTAEETDSAEG